MNPTSTRLIPTELERADLLRALTAWTSNPAIADDLVQQTMIEAWKSDRQPSPDEWRPWLFGVARMVLLRWRRDLARDLRRSIAEPANESVLAAISTDADIDTELEQQEIVSLLHDVLDELPAETRQVLLLKYIHELPQAEIAGQLGLHEKALEGRLHRGKQKLRQQLITNRPDSALSMGLITEANTWQTTNYWCRTCGRHRLLARWTDSGELWFDCPSCLNGSRVRHYEGGLFQSRNPNRRPTFAKIMQYFQIQTELCGIASSRYNLPCPAECDGSLTRSFICANTELDSVPRASLRFDCDTCECRLTFENIFETGIDSLVGHEFLRKHQKVVSIPPILTKYYGADAVKSSWFSLDSTDQFSVWHLAISGQIIHTAISDN